MKIINTFVWLLIYYVGTFTEEKFNTRYYKCSATKHIQPLISTFLNI